MQAARERREQPLPISCMDELRAFFVEGARTGSLKNPVEGFREACSEDIAAFCPGQQGPALVVCLKAKKRRQGLQPACDEKVFELQHQEAKALELDVKFMDACKGDFKRFHCQAQRALGSRKACLNSHFKNLTSKCQGALFERLQDDLSDVRLNQGLYQVCRKEISTVCGTIAYGEARIIKCLWDEMDGATFSGSCRKMVKELTRLKVADYRLDYRIRTRCARDIPRLCSEEQKAVDGLSAAELFAGDWHEGKSGQVMHCLKANFRSIEDEACTNEVKHLIRVHAKDPTSDRSFAAQCQADIKHFCNDTSASRVHHCLRLHLGKLTPGCRAAELLQGSLASMEIELKPEMETRCKADIQEHCGQVQKREAQVIQCLQDRMEEDKLTKPCHEAVELDLEASNRDWRLKFGVHESCRTEADRLCADISRNESGQVLTCLKSHHTRIGNTACKHEIFRYIKQGAYSIKFNPTSYKLCMGDVGRLCSGVQPGQGRVHECLLRHHADLSQGCKSAEFSLQKLQAEDIRTHPKAMKLCRSSMASLCADVPPALGRKWECLMQHKDSPKMSEGCRAVVFAQTRLSNYHFELDHTLTKYCGSEAARLCPIEVSLSQSKPFGNEGAVIGCLIRQREKLQNIACRAKLMTKASQRLANIENDPTASKTCQTDVEAFCSDVEGHGNGEVHKCLQQHLPSLTSPCRAVEIDYLAMAAEDLRLMSWMDKECGAARQRYCNGVEDVGRAYVAVCMLQNMHRNAMEPGCRQKLVELQKVQAMNIRFNPLLARECQSDLIRIQQNHPTLAECAPQRDDTIALSGLAIRCLTDHRKEVKRPECQSAILNILRQQSNDLRAKPGMEKACAEDIAALCNETHAGKGRVHACLRRNAKQIKSKQCSDMVSEVLKAEKEDATISPRVREHCSNEMQVFCSNVEHGEARVLNCLRQYQRDPRFSASCAKELSSLGFNATKAISAVGTELASSEAKNVLSSLLRERNYWAKWGPLVIAGAGVILGSLFIGIVAVVVCLRKRPVYGIEVEQAEKEDA